MVSSYYILNLLWNQTHAAQGSDIPQDASKDGMTIGEKITFGTVMTRLFTWDKLGLNRFEKLSEAFWVT